MTISDENSQISLRIPNVTDADLAIHPVDGQFTENDVDPTEHRGSGSDKEGRYAIVTDPTVSIDEISSRGNVVVWTWIPRGDR